MNDVSARTGVECMVIAVRSSHDDFLKPQIHVTDDRIHDFFQTLFSQSISDFVIKLEAFFISGIAGMSIGSKSDFTYTNLYRVFPAGLAKTYSAEMTDLKQSAGALILRKLREHPYS